MNRFGIAVDPFILRDVQEPPTLSLRSRFALVLARLPKRVSRYGYDLLRWPDLRAFRKRVDDKPLALLASHDLSASGAPRIVLEMAQALLARGFSVLVVAMADGQMRGEFERAGATILIDPRPRADADYLRSLAQDAAIAIVNSAASAPLAAIWSQATPTIWYLHEVSLLQSLIATGRIDGPLKSATRIWAGSELCAAIVRPCRSDVLVLPYGIEALSGRQSNSDGPLHVAVFGSIERRKGQDLALDGLSMLSAEERAQIRLTLYGRVLEPDFAKKVLAACAASPSACFGGELDRAGYVAAMGEVDAVLVSSREDTLPLVSIDALSAGRTLLLTRAVGTSAWLNDGRDALIEQVADAASMRALYQRALEARPQAMAFGAAARAAFEKNFSLEAFVTTFFAEIDAMLEQRND